ncbi:MAG: radical SAM protein, partial [Candidatus Eisenbacteria bacterium]|nr:radical SAM protein [Candidatus Eisenbacteria bacterium]
MPAPDVREGPPGAGDGTARIRTGPGLYVHVPFCRRRCGYCDFYVEIRDDAIRARTVEAILEEAERRAGSWPHGCFDSVFLGGGTPSLLGPERLERLLRGLRERLPIGADAEWTMEANPESANAELLDAALAGGVNRLSLGAQSFDPAELAMLDRLHDADQARLCLLYTSD